ncbi:ERCC4 domain-containing protein [Podospora didyma]|uniref:ERCC4 domain-containing protein n=1 Tax=Podospora didyma TaxID=330526 RepID=A0AAE0NT38_9PEZI|nr:ERCC4 domain-containing protein [Podospora didyma]
MSIEVISLLSSPEVGVASPPATKRSSPGLPPKPKLPARRLDYESPVQNEGSFFSRNALPAFSITGFEASDDIADDDSWFLPNTSNTSRHISVPIDGLATSSSPTRKRPRLATVDGNMTRKKSGPLPPTKKHVPTAGTSRLKPASEQLVISSLPRLNLKAAKPRLDEFDSDPFASSSPFVKEKENKRTSTEGALVLLDDDFDRFPTTSSPKNEYRPRKSPKRPVAWDPISSSAPLTTVTNVSKPANPARPLGRSYSEVIALDDSDDDVVPLEGSDDEFPDIINLRPTAAATGKLRPFAPTTRHVTSARPLPKPGNKSKPPPAPRKSAEEREKEKEKKAAAQEAEKKRKLAEKKRKLAEKEQARVQKALEKERADALADVNKIRTDKKISTPEMIVDLPTSLGHTIQLQAETLLKDLDVQFDSWSCTVENVVRWRRKMHCRYNEELSHWEPIPMEIQHEPYAMVIIPATQFVQLARGQDSVSLETHVLQMKAQFPTQTIIYMIEGLTPWLRKNRNFRNRQFATAVRSNPDEETGAMPPPSTQVRRRNNATTQEYVDEDIIEDALLELQVLHRVLIHHTAAAVETAQWIAVFTQHISTVPYRRQREEANDASAGFCMDSGQVRTGDSARDIYVRMLQEISRITAPIAYGIAGEFETVSQLVRGLETGGPLSLEGIRKSANKDGAVSDRPVGQAISKRIHKIFTGRDELSTDV